MRPVIIHTGAWRFPGAWPDANINLAHLITLLSAHSQVTERIGLIATASTTFDAPYHIARRFASLDHISNGRAGWNIVTTSNPDAALNCGHDEQMDHDERYRRAHEFYEVVTGLWIPSLTMPSYATWTAASISTPRACTRSATRASICPCAGRSTRFARNDRHAGDDRQMQEWLEGRGSDGFNVLFPWLPGGLDDFCESVMPELQRRGLFRREYEGATLRENLGLPRPENRFFE